MLKRILVLAGILFIILSNAAAQANPAKTKLAVVGLDHHIREGQAVFTHPPDINSG